MLPSAQTLTQSDRDTTQHNMKITKSYYIEMRVTTRKQATSGFNGFDTANAFFSTEENCGTKEFVAVMVKAIERTAAQQARYWEDYAVGRCFIQKGWEKVSPMSPAYEYRTEASSHVPVWVELGDYTAEVEREWARTDQLKEHREATKRHRERGADGRFKPAEHREPTGPWATQDDYI